MNVCKIALGVFTVFMLFSCNQDDDCNGTFAIEKVVPNNNPPGSEVSIRGTGFSSKTEVRFAGQIAKSKFTNELGLVVTIPNNVSGVVDLTVAEGNCLARTDFEVLGTLPVNWVASPTVIIIPTFPVSFPTSINNEWVNFFDSKHHLSIQPNGGICNFQNIEPGNLETHDTNAFLNNNPITGYYDCPDGKILLIIDRTSKGSFIDTLDGNLILPQSVGDDNNSGNLYMVLTSRITGRQLLITTKQ